MAKRRSRSRVPLVSLLDTSKVHELARAIDQMAELVQVMKGTLPGLVELANVSRELLAITSRMHAAEQQQAAADQEQPSRRSAAARKANETRRARRAEVVPAIAGTQPAIERNGEEGSVT